MTAERRAVVRTRFNSCSVTGVAFILATSSVRCVTGPADVEGFDADSGTLAR